MNTEGLLRRCEWDGCAEARAPGLAFCPLHATTLRRAVCIEDGCVDLPVFGSSYCAKHRPAVVHRTTEDLKWSDRRSPCVADGCPNVRLWGSEYCQAHVDAVAETMVDPPVEPASACLACGQTLRSCRCMVPSPSPPPRRYAVNEVFQTVQGEGVNAGRVAWFVRLAGCNLTCSGEEVEGAFQPVCDTEFVSRRLVTAVELAMMIPEGARLIVLTGGEPMLQVDEELLMALVGRLHRGFDEMGRIAIETNGTREIPTEWWKRFKLYVTVSPKTAEHTLKVKRADELRYVRAEGHAIPRPSVACAAPGGRVISPHWDADPAQTRRNIEWCLNLVKENPRWRISLPIHKLMQVR